MLLCWKNYTLGNSSLGERVQMKILFLDRDGVINREINYLHKISDFEFIEGVFESLKYIQNLGYKLIIVSNQSGIGRGMYDLKDFETLNNWMLKEFEKYNIKILDVYICPHSPDENCSCRKPKDGLFRIAFSEYKVEKKSSWMIGDSERDIVAARKAGIENTILVRSGHKIEENRTAASYVIDSISSIRNVIKK